MATHLVTIDRLLEDASDLIEAGDYREARRLMHGIEALHPSPEQLANTQFLLDVTGPNRLAYAVTGVIGMFLLVLSVVLFFG